MKLNSEQQKAFRIIEKSLFKKSSPIVLEGVTGSGKTEVYFEAIEKVIKEKKQALIMLPEISLTPQLELRFKERFGFTPDIWHSKIAEKKTKKYMASLLSRRTTYSCRGTVEFVFTF